MMKVGHWILNGIGWAGTLVLVYLAFFGQGPNASIFNRVMTLVAAAMLGFITFKFTVYTLKKG